MSTEVLVKNSSGTLLARKKLYITGWSRIANESLGFVAFESVSVIAARNTAYNSEVHVYCKCKRCSAVGFETVEVKNIYFGEEDGDCKEVHVGGLCDLCQN